MSETKGDIVKSYTYDANGNRTSFVAPNININTSYTYDSLGRMLTVSDTAFGTTSYTYDANSNVTRVANGATTATMSYDAQNRLVSKFSGADTYTLTYYNDGNVKRVTDSEGTINYTYNETGALASGDGATYKYDIYGNRSEMTKDGSIYRYYYDMNNRLIREADFAGNIASAYKYDNNGNLLERQHMPEPTTPTENASATLSVVSAPTFTTDTFTFDVLGRMSSATVNGTTTTYTYDGNGLRQTKNNKAFVYDGANIVWEGESLATGTTYYRGLELIARSSNHGFARYQTDWHGNIEGYDYDDFGNPTGGNATNPFRYNGEYYDEETGFIYLRARYYDPGVGRFVSEDPIRDGVNWYAYCANDPVNAVDPSGLEYVKLREMVEMLGGSISWNPDTNTATVTIDNITVSYTNNPYAYYEDGNDPIIIDSTMYVDDMNFYDDFDRVAYKYDSGDVAGKVVIINQNVSIDNVSASIGNKDFLVIDYRRRPGNNPAMEIRDCYKTISAYQRYEVIDILLALETKDPTKWERTKPSLNFEWFLHAEATPLPFIGGRGKDAMLDNDGEKWMVD